MRRLLALVRRRIAGADLGGGPRPLRVDPGSQRIRIGLGGQPAHRHRDAVGIAEMLRPVGIGELHRLHHQVDRLGAVVAALPEVHRLEQVQHLHQMHPAGGGRRHGGHRMAPVAAAHRLADHRPVGAEILQGHDAAMGGQRGDDAGGRRALVEAGRALLGDGLQRAGEVLLHQPVAPPGGAAIGFQEDAPRGGKAPEPRRGARQRIREVLVHRDAVPGEADGGRDQFGEAHSPRSPTPMRLGEARHRPRHARREP